MEELHGCSERGLGQGERQEIGREGSQPTPNASYMQPGVGSEACGTAFVTWLRERDNIFRVKGKAGSGKSTLMKFICIHPRTTEHLQAWAGGEKIITAKYFFWNAGTELQRSYNGLMRSLLFDILRLLSESCLLHRLMPCGS